MHNHQTLSNGDSDVRKGWRRVSFGDVVRNIDTSVHDPLSAGIERFVGLDHLDAESLRIRRWGKVADGTTFTRRFIPGQVLFGKRRAYQRKVALADFDGICSGDILVFEPANDDLLPELLPFIAQSEGFFQHALRTSAGSLSPRTRWSDLAKYEFLLPPKDEQRRIVEILAAAEEASERHCIARDEATRSLSVLIANLFTRGLDVESLQRTDRNVCLPRWNVKRLDEVATVDRGKFAHRPRNLPRFYGGRFPFVQTGDIAASSAEPVNRSETVFEVNY